MPEVIPEAVLIIGAFFLLVTALILRGLLAGYNYSLGSIFAWLNTHMRVRVHLPVIGTHTINFGSPFGVINGAIIDSMQAGIRDCEKYLAYCWHASEALLRYTVESIDFLARETAHTFEWLAHSRIPKVIKYAVPVTLSAALLARIVKAVLPLIHATITKPVTIIYRTIPHEAARVARKAIPAVVPGAIALPKVWDEIHGLTKRNLRLAKRLRRVEALFGASVFAVAMANAIGGVTANCIRRGNIGKVARSICGIPTRLLDDLLGIIADVWILENVCVLLPYLEEGASVIGTPLVEALTVAGSGLCKGYAAPGALRGPAARLPAPVFSGAAALV